MIQRIAVLTLMLVGFARAEEEKPVWLAVGRPELAPALAKLVEHRRAQGYETIVSTESVEKALAAARRPPAFLLLVGDDEPGQAEAPWYLPSPRRPLYRWRKVQRKEFASDALYGDLDGDLVPDIPVGRLPARSEEEAAALVAKVLAFERRPPGERDLRLVVWGGAPGYGKLVDSMATGLLRSTVRQHTPPLLDRYMISADPGRDLCGWPPDQPAIFAREMREGSLLSAVLAHASARRIYAVEHEKAWVRFGAAEARGALAEGPPAAPLVLLTCSCGEFADAKPCLAEELLQLAGGPVAVIAATTESHPLTNYFSGVSLLKALGETDGSIGEVWLEAQRRALTARHLLVEKALEGAEGSLEPEIDVGKLRRDQALMYALLGDPATRMKLPAPIDVTVERTEEGWRWKVPKPEGAARLLVGLRPPKPPKTKKPPVKDAEEARARFAAANALGAFAPLATLSAEEPWEGVVTKEGWLRIVVTGPGVFRAAAVKLE
ncbi:MAG: C25 family cysteine peptidase [Planctomycetota bacterium]|jgi:hypothetical protein